MLYAVLKTPPPITTFRGTYVWGLLCRDIAELTQHANRLENELSQFGEENEALREKLGLKADASVDVSGVRARRVTELEKLRRESRLLENQVKSCYSMSNIIRSIVYILYTYMCTHSMHIVHICSCVHSGVVTYSILACVYIACTLYICSCVHSGCISGITIDCSPHMAHAGYNTTLCT